MSVAALERIHPDAKLVVERLATKLDADPSANRGLHTLTEYADAAVPVHRVRWAAKTLAIGRPLRLVSWSQGQGSRAGESQYLTTNGPK